MTFENEIDSLIARACREKLSTEEGNALGKRLRGIERTHVMQDYPKLLAAKLRALADALENSLPTIQFPPRHDRS